MQYSEQIYEGGISEEINRICGVTNAVYSNKAKIARLNNALDRYWFLVSESGPKGTLDDTNLSNAPIETQNLVAGTNAYKISSFTSKVLQILRIAILDDDAEEADLVREAFDEIDEFNETYSTAAADRGTPTHWTKIGDYIYIRPCPNYNETSGLRAYINRELSKFVFVSFTVAAATDLFSATAHGLAANDALIFETDGTIPAGITADTTIYYVISSGLTADAFKVSTAIGGSTIDVTDAGTGNHKFIKVSKEPGIPVIHHPYLARQVALPFLLEKKLPQLAGIMAQIQQDELAITKYWAHRDKDLRNKMTFYKRNFK